MKLTRQKNTTRQKGAVSLFIVIFTALLITTITISFMQIMMKDQRQALSSDLSESAYDSAVAGVEDAKRALLLEQDCIGDTSPRCNDIRAAIASGECTTLSSIASHLGGTAAVDGETRIRQSVGDEQLEQAYTCVKITADTGDFLGSFDSASAATLIPLRSTGDFDTVVISWNQSESGGAIDLPTAGDSGLPPIDEEEWPQDRPALLRAQLINGSGHGSFELAQLDTSGYSNTLFLHPSRAGSGSIDFALDGRRGSNNYEAQPARCRATVSSGEYACEVELSTTAPITAANSRMVFLGLAALYNPTNYRIQLKNGDDIVRFDGVQPEVDSTGRANDLFRRVVSRVELGNTFRYPLAALETSGSLCKNFSVTTDPNDYDPADCTP